MNYRERRKQADWVVNAATALSLISWLVAVGAVIFIDQAAPQRENFFTQVYGGTVRAVWDANLLPIALIFLILSLLSCAAAFIFNMLRMRRKTDKVRKSIVIIGGINVIAMAIFLIRFGAYL